VLFLAGILFSAALSILSTAYFGRKNYIAQEREISAQTLRALADNLKLKTDYVRRDTDTVFWTPLVQNALDSLKTGPMTPETRAFINDSLSPIMLAGDYISSILFYDNYGNSCICLRDGVLVDSGMRARRTPTGMPLPPPRTGTGSTRPTAAGSSATRTATATSCR
jgi:hypothetical protein